MYQLSCSKMSLLVKNMLCGKILPNFFGEICELFDWVYAESDISSRGKVAVVAICDEVAQRFFCFFSLLLKFL